MWPYMWDAPHPLGCRCQDCYRRLFTTHTTSTFTFRETHRCETWAEAVRFANDLRRRHLAMGKPEVRRAPFGTGWTVRWVPMFHATLTNAIPAQTPA